VIIYICL